MRTFSGTVIVFFLVAAASLSPFLSLPAYAFHSGGVGDCGGCHAMHTPHEGKAIEATSNSSFLIIASDPSSTCLTCHQQAGEKTPTGHHVSTEESDMPEGSPPVQMTPGGDFGWLKKSYRWNSANGSAGGQSPGESHGHNIVASDYGFTADSTLTTAPGGTYSAANLSCTSCHDPHGRYRRFADGTIGITGAPVQSSGSYDTSPDPTSQAAVGVYRMLGGKGYTASSTMSEPFSFDPPAAVSPADYNRTEASTETRVAYGAGMSEWCINCHKNLGRSGGNSPGHPAGNAVKMTSQSVGNYSGYIASGNTSGKSSTSFSSLVPFEMGIADYSVLRRTASNNGSMTTGPDTVSNVMCLTCHRAHASAWDKAARWNMKAEFLIYNGEYPGADRPDIPVRYSQGRTMAETRRAFYEQPASRYSAYQRSFCNKCHAKD